MDHGHIEQAGPADAVYSRPESTYVARFMGGQNVLCGRVTGNAGGNLQLEGPRGSRFELAAPQFSPPVDGTVWFAVRRDRVTLESARTGSTGGANRAPGTVRAIEYQGSWVKVTVDGPSDEEFVAHVPDDRFLSAPFAPGDEVVAHWSREEIHPLAKVSDTGRARA